jgi:hypothetical protein
VPLEHAGHARCAIHAVADEANASARQTLDSGDPYLLREARSHDLTLIERNQEHPAHRLSARFAAAMASLALV